MYRLDEQSFRALSSKTRVSLLKALQARNYTITELAEHLGKSSPTIKEHIIHLSRAGLVRKVDSGHKWKYYTLTAKGTSIFDSEKTFALDLVILIIGAIGVISSFVYSFISDASAHATERIATAPTMAMDLAGSESATIATSQVGSNTVLLVLAFLFASIALLSLIRILRR